MFHLYNNMCNEERTAQAGGHTLVVPDIGDDLEVHKARNCESSTKLFHDNMYQELHFNKTQVSKYVYIINCKCKAH